MHSRCCWPPERPGAGLVAGGRRPRPTGPALRSAASTFACRSPRPRELRRRPAATLSKIDIVGNGLGFWKTIPIARRTATTSTDGSYTSRSVEQHPALGARPGDLLVHAVDAADHRRLAAARGADDRRHLVGAELEVDALDLLGVAVEGAQLLQPDAHGRRLRPPRPGAPRRRRRRSWRRRAPAARLVRRLRSGSGCASSPGWPSGSMSATLRGRWVESHARRLLREMRRAMRLSSRIIDDERQRRPPRPVDDGASWAR